MKERGRNERKMVQGWKGGAGLTEGGLESQSVERWKWTDDGKWAGELEGRPYEDRVKCTGGTGDRVKTQQEKEAAEKTN